MRLYRLWCGKKRYSHWLPDRSDLMRVALRHGLAFEGQGDTCHLGPLTWIEVGERSRPKARTVRVHVEGVTGR